MTVNRLQRTVLLLFVAVVADSLVAVVLRAGSIQAFADGDRSWTTLVALGGTIIASIVIGIVLSRRAWDRAR